MECKHNPTPEEIKSVCREIRAGWDKVTRRQRAAWYYEGRKVEFEEIEIVMVDSKRTAAQIGP